MGVVYYGREPDGTPVAVKIVRDSLADAHEFRARFAREVAAMKGVRGPRTANLVAANVLDTPQWVVMEYVSGPTLADQVRAGGSLTGARLVALVRGVVGGLTSIHRAHVVHRDLKPANVIMAADGPVIVDFGIARALDSVELTTVDQRVGSVTWMAPEQLAGTPAGPACDIFAFGLLAHWAATERHPWGEGEGDAVAWRMTREPPDLDSLPPVAGLRSLLDQCLRHDPQLRPDVAQLRELAAALQG